MSKNYDKNLRYKIPATNNKKGVVLNSNFQDWEDHIEENLRTRDSTGGATYVRGLDKKLLRLCQEHSKDFQQKKWRGNTIMLTHPFYLHLCHMNELKNKDVKKEADDYLTNLLDFLSLKRNRENVGVVALETIHHYAAMTSLLLERGLIENVIFTKYDNGRPLDIDEFKKYKKDQIFFGGGYNKKCLSSSINALGLLVPNSHIWAIRELVLDSPQDQPYKLGVDKVKRVDDIRVISLAQTKKRLNLRN